MVRDAAKMGISYEIIRNLMLARVEQRFNICRALYSM